MILTSTAGGVMFSPGHMTSWRGSEARELHLPKADEIAVQADCSSLIADSGILR